MSAISKRKPDGHSGLSDLDAEKRRRLEEDFTDVDINVAGPQVSNEVHHQALDTKHVSDASSPMGFGDVPGVTSVEMKDQLLAVETAESLVEAGIHVPSVTLADGVSVVPAEPETLHSQSSTTAALAASAHALVAGTGVNMNLPQSVSYETAAQVVGDAQIANAAAAAAAAADAAAVVVAPGLLQGNPAMAGPSPPIQSIVTVPSAQHEFHTDGRPRPFICGTCGKGFLRTGDKNRHIKTVHERVRKAICHICGGQFGHKGDLGRHIARVHEKGEFRKCSTCGATFQSNAAFNAHLKIHAKRAGSGTPFPCSHCRKSFENDAIRLAHEAESHATLKFTCDVPECRAKFPSARSLKAHTQAKHTLVLTCQHCPAAFRLRDELLAHVEKRHTGPAATVPEPPEAI